jgi:glycosyltransferase involved in cell wall biosynthesis
MHVIITSKSQVPPLKYGGIERVIYSLGKELSELGHRITYLVEKGSTSDFADIIHIDNDQEIRQQIPGDADVVHLHYLGDKRIFESFPCLLTLHGNTKPDTNLPLNTVFISKNHAERHASNRYIYNGLRWEDIMIPTIKSRRNYFHFVGKAAWRVKNVKGAIEVIKKARNQKLEIIGGKRLNFNMGFRLTLSRKINFRGMVDDMTKYEIMSKSRGLIFPVLWHEPFGLAIIESLASGCPVFGTPYGSLPELVPSFAGFLSSSRSELSNAIECWNTYSHEDCRAYAIEKFNAKVMAENYIKLYELVLKGQQLNPKQPANIETSSSKFLRWDP